VHDTGFDAVDGLVDKGLIEQEGLSDCGFFVRWHDVDDDDGGIEDLRRIERERWARWGGWSS